MGSYRYDISLRFRHPSIDPGEITDTLGIKPQFAWRAGDQRATPRGQPLDGAYRESYWCGGVVAGNSRSVHISDALHALLDKLEPNKAFFHRIRAEGGRVEFFIGWFIKASGGDDLDQRLLRRLVDLQVDLGLDHYHDPDFPDDEEAG